MSSNFWKYATVEMCHDFLLSLNLLNTMTMSPKKQLETLYAISNTLSQHYRKISIPKKDGSYRTIYEPSPLLKSIQKNILTNVLNGRSCSIYATAYQKNKSFVANATPHVNQPLIYKLDIEDFFDSIDFLKVYQYAFPTIYFPPPVAGILTHLCCYNHCLPQGAPTSPMISNLVLKPFDDYIGTWCLERNIHYTRYCDDMTFSGDFNVKQLHNKVQSFLETMNFTINKKKTRLISQHEQQLVTGITVNKKTQVPKSYRKKVRQETYYCLKFGTKSHLIKTKNKEYMHGDEIDTEGYLRSVLGKIDYIISINPDDQEFIGLREHIIVLLSDD